jgi:hypothetical protein
VPGQKLPPQTPAFNIALAQRYLAAGYPPVPILRHDDPVVVRKRGMLIKQTPGKQPHGTLWSKKETMVYGATRATVGGWATPSGHRRLSRRRHRLRRHRRSRIDCTRPTCPTR